MIKNQKDLFDKYAYLYVHKTQAGLPNKMLRIALEPEAASVYVQFLPIEKQGHGFAMTKTGTKYMVVDIGGEWVFKIYILSRKFNFITR